MFSPPPPHLTGTRPYQLAPIQTRFSRPGPKQVHPRPNRDYPDRNLQYRRPNQMNRAGLGYGIPMKSSIEAYTDEGQENSFGTEVGLKYRLKDRQKRTF